MKRLFSILCVTLFCLAQVSSQRALDYTDYKGVVRITNRYYNESCIGAVIHPEWILTSAVCALRTFHQEMRLNFGGNYYGFEKAAHIKNTYIHPGFISEIREDDIALIELSKPVDESVRIFKIPRTSSSLVAKKGRVLRWTYYQDKSPESMPEFTPEAYIDAVTTRGTASEDPTLRSDDYYNYQRVVFLNNELCSNYAVHISENRLCTYKSIACEGDEGAPLVTEDSNELVGLISVSAVQAAVCYNYNDCMFPVTTYTSVVPHRSWIREVTDLNLL